MAKFVPPLNEVSFPAYARIKTDAAAVRWSFLKTVRILMLVAAPFYCGLAVVAGPMVETLFGAKWPGMVPYIQLSSLALILMTVPIPFAPVTNALGTDRQSVVEGKSVSVRVDLGCRRIIIKK